jgi:hypothetical protein
MPVERKPRSVNWRSVFIVLGALLAVSLIMILALAFVPA